MEPEVRYCMTSDGVRIAYTVTGEGPPLIFAMESTASHVQLECSNPVLGTLLGELARTNTLIRFDLRGTGLSDRTQARQLDDFVLDVEAVLKRAGCFPICTRQHRYSDACHHSLCGATLGRDITPRDHRRVRPHGRPQEAGPRQHPRVRQR